jgi:sugar lactone lactonase YvrE
MQMDGVELAAASCCVTPSRLRSPADHLAKVRQPVQPVVWAQVGGDGICLDTEGAVWCADMTDTGSVCMRVREGGEVLQRIELDAACFACMLGGDDGKTLFMMVADWQGIEKMGELFQSRTGRVLTAAAPTPRLGWP